MAATLEASPVKHFEINAARAESVADQVQGNALDAFCAAAIVAVETGHPPDQAKLAEVLIAAGKTILQWNFFVTTLGQRFQAAKEIEIAEGLRLEEQPLLDVAYAEGLVEYELIKAEAEKRVEDSMLKLQEVRDAAVSMGRRIRDSIEGAESTLRQTSDPAISEEISRLRKSRKQLEGQLVNGPVIESWQSGQSRIRAEVAKIDREIAECEKRQLERDCFAL